MDVKTIRKYFTKADVAKLAGVTPSAIWLASEFGKLQIAALTQNGTRLFEHSEVERYLRTRKNAQRRRQRRSETMD